MARNILVVDDEVVGRDQVGRAPNGAGYSVRCVSSGKEAVALLGTRVPDAVVLDYNMPGMDGVAVLEVFRSYLRWADVPVVMLSADPNDPRLWHVSDHGVRHVVAKSSDQYLMTLLNALEEIARSPSGKAPKASRKRPRKKRRKQNGQAAQASPRAAGRLRKGTKKNVRRPTVGRRKGVR